MMRSAVLVLLAATVSACGASAVSELRSAKAETQLQNSLRGKVAGEAFDCLPFWRSGNMVIIDDNTLLFQDGRNLVYRNDPPGGCSPIGRGNYTLVTKTIGSGMCRGDIATVVDLSAGITVGSCALGEFIPYKTASR